jgi:hypothetical protein
VSLLTSLAGRAAQVALVGPAIARAKRKAVRFAIGGTLLALFGVIGLVYLLAALRTVLEGQIGPIWAPLAIGGGLFVLAGIAYLAFLRPRASESAKAASQADAVRDKIVGPARMLEGQVAQRPLQSLAIALAVGFAGASLLRLLRGRESQRAPRTYDGTGQAPPPHPSRAERPAWMREVVLRETDRRKGDGRYR